jgi:hypothetical protein
VPELSDLSTLTVSWSASCRLWMAWDGGIVAFAAPVFKDLQAQLHGSGWRKRYRAKANDNTWVPLGSGRRLKAAGRRS